MKGEEEEEEKHKPNIGLAVENAFIFKVELWAGTA